MYYLSQIKKKAFCSIYVYRNRKRDWEKKTSYHKKTKQNASTMETTMPLAGYTIFNLSFFFFLDVFNHNEIMIHWCCNYFCIKTVCVDISIFFPTVRLHFSLPFHWYLLKMLLLILSNWPWRTFGLLVINYRYWLDTCGSTVLIFCTLTALLQRYKQENPCQMLTQALDMSRNTDAIM